ncbi:unnamed protein product [Allacma fusca]|uniref:Uncharacterized protein n=1 Tax=Allacma fusca TaxID=39272 RepID=A0A8J2NWS5_9HEXA|nr:unnamed protein product [Allacma fusca]
MGSSLILLATFLGVTSGHPTVNYGPGQPIAQPVVYLNLDLNRLPAHYNQEHRTSNVVPAENNLGLINPASQNPGLYSAPSFEYNAAAVVPAVNIQTSQNIGNSNGDSYATPTEGCGSNCQVVAKYFPAPQNSVSNQNYNDQEVSSQNARIPEYTTSVSNNGGSSGSDASGVYTNMAENVATAAAEQINGQQQYNVPGQSQVFSPIPEAQGQNTVGSQYGPSDTRDSGITGGSGQVTGGFASNNAYGSELPQNVKQENFSKSNSETGFTRTHGNGQTESFFKTMSSHQFSSFHSYTQ